MFFFETRCRGIQILLRPPKGSTFAGNSRYGIQIVKYGQEMRFWRVAKKSEKEKNLPPNFIQIETQAQL